jgi:hypothetical protein
MHQEQARPLSAGRIQNREPTFRNTAQGDLGLGSSVTFGLLIWSHRCQLEPRNDKLFTLMGRSCEMVQNEHPFQQPTEQTQEVVRIKRPKHKPENSPQFNFKVYNVCWFTLKYAAWFHTMVFRHRGKFKFTFSIHIQSLAQLIHMQSFLAR